MFALVDCDHFFASCERVFRPDLWRRPVAVLSNNDGCVIARSPEVKALGVAMGMPAFQCQALFQRHRVAVFSANFSLYADLSARINRILRQHVDSFHHQRLEVYSIDEAFIDLRHLQQHESQLLHFAQYLRQQILTQTGIPVSIGIGRTKTLAKLATYFAKKSKERVCSLLADDKRERALQHTPIDQIWGIGRQWSQKLNRFGIEKASDLVKASPAYLNWASRHSYLKRTARELQGESCIPLELNPPARRSIQYSRSFATAIKDQNTLESALSEFAHQLGRRLRSHQLKTGTLLLTLISKQAPNDSYHQKKRPQYEHIKLSLSLPYHADDSSTLISSTRLLAQQLMESQSKHKRKAYMAWCKASLLALDLRDHSQLELGLIKVNEARRTLSTLEDELNRRFGRGTARIGGLPIKPNQSSSASWAPKKAYLSPRYTSCWADLPIIEA